MSSLADILFVEWNSHVEQFLRTFFESIDPTIPLNLEQMPSNDELIYTHFDGVFVSAALIDDGDELHKSLRITPTMQVFFDGGRATMAPYRDAILKGVLKLIASTDFNFAWLFDESDPVLVRNGDSVILNSAYPYTTSYPYPPYWTEDRLKLLPPHTWADFPRV